jgi:adenine deaminase
MPTLAHLIAVAKGDIPADLLLTNARIVNVFTSEIEEGNIAICGDRIAGLGDYKAKEVVEVGGRHIAPGLINGHIHPESSMLDIGQYARAVVPHGTTTLITDLHEIANVSGLKGIQYVLERARHLPLNLFLMAPSCVPATDLETSGATLGPEEIGQILKRKECLGLGEMMNFPGVIGGDAAVLKKIEYARGKIIDGHAPGLGGRALSAYIAAGIYSDHESVSLDEAREKLRRGMYLMIREGSSEKNLEALLPLVDDKTWPRCMFVVDDRSAADLLHDGDIDAVVRKAIRLGLDPVRAIQLATINPAGYFRREGLGGIAPGYFADLIVLGDLKSLSIDMVFHRGKLVAKEGQPLFSAPKSGDNSLSDSVSIKPFNVEALRLATTEKETPVIEVVPGQIVTRKSMEKLTSLPDIEKDILKLVVVERHKATGNIGVGPVKGFGLKTGALASSVAHDSHNVIAVGASDEDIYTAIKEVERLHGGLVAAGGGKVLASLALPVAGLLSNEPLENVVASLEKLERTAIELGAKLASPLATLSFLALPVIPEIRLTDRGMVEL